MENTQVLKWLRGSGDGSGDGSDDGCIFSNGSGSGRGSGFGFGCNYGRGNLYGDGLGGGISDCECNGGGFYDCERNGSGGGSDDGRGIGDGCWGSQRLIKVNGNNIYYIDNLPTIITSIIGNYAKGFAVVESDYEIRPCFIAKDEFSRYFAHGKTLREAQLSLQGKITQNMTDEERIQTFCDTFKKGNKYKGSVFFKWHNILTGSCLMGREQFVKDHNLSLDNEYTVDEFITITQNAYGSDIIRELKNFWKKGD